MPDCESSLFLPMGTRQGREASHQLDDGTMASSGVAEFLWGSMVGCPALNSFCPARMGMGMGMAYPCLICDEPPHQGPCGDPIPCLVPALLRGHWSPGTAVAVSGLGHRSWQWSCLPDWRVMDKALTPSPGRPRSRETLQTR